MKLSPIHAELDRLGLRPSKSMGQNFLHDRNLARWIVNQLELAPEDHLVEIGPGLGALTGPALKQCGSATLIEKDRRLAGWLDERHATESVRVLNADATGFDVRTLFRHGSVKVLGNLPYYVSSQILFRFTDEPSPVTRLVFTLQKELAERLSAEPATKDYGALTLVIGRRWRVKFLRTLPPGVFLPPPKVDSAVVLLTQRAPDELPECDGSFFNAIVKLGFSQRRKQLRKMLAEYVRDWLPISEKLGLPETARAEELGLGHWIALANLLKPCVADAQEMHGEIFDVTDAEDRVTGAASRHEVHARKLFHRAVHVFVFNRAGELFLQKRSRRKDVHPSKWDSSAAGHVNAGESYDDTAIREVEEELGVLVPVRPIAKIPASENTGFEFVQLYTAQHDGPFMLARAEIEAGAFFPMEIVRRWIMARPGDFASGFIECFNRHSECQESQS